MPRNAESSATKLLKLAQGLSREDLLLGIDIFKHQVSHAKQTDRSQASASRSESPKGRGRRRATSPDAPTDSSVVVG